MASLWDLLTHPIRDHYNYDQLARESDSLAQNRYTHVGQQNAFRHAYVSALLALRHSLTESRLLGDARESGTTYDYYLGTDKDYRTDTYRDLYNNAVGRAIGAHAKQNGLTESEVADLVDHAVSSGQAIVSIRKDDPDPRLPYIDSKSFRISPEPGLFNGWPIDFPNIPNIWTSPQKRNGLSNQPSQPGDTSFQYADNAVPKFGGSGILSGGGWGGILSGVFPE